MEAYNERLTVPASWWGLAAGAGFTAGLILLVLGPLAAHTGVVAGAGLTGILLVRHGGTRVRVADGTLFAGPARIPLTALGEARALDQEEARSLRMEAANPRAFLLMRSYIPCAVRVEVADPDDPTPYLYLSTRRPELLVRVLDAVRALPWPGGSPYVWGGAESRTLTQIRKHLRNEVGLAREQVSLVGYWRRNPEDPLDDGEE